MTPLRITVIALFLVACSRGEPPLHQTRYAVFGTVVEVSVRSFDASAVELALAELGQDLQRAHQDWHPWRPGALTELNAALLASTEHGQAVALSGDLRTLIEASQTMEQRSGGAFNAAIGRLVGLWGFHTSHYPITDPPPLPVRVQALASQAPSSLAVRLTEQGAISDNPVVAFDFSGIAKGVAAELACQRLVQYGLEDALINLGGDVMSCGRGVRPWRVAVADPRSSGRTEISTVIELDQRMAVFTSGSSQRFGEWDGQRYAHILDPRTGFPLGHALQATVIDPDPVLADAAATALVVAGPDGWRELAQAMAVQAVIVIDESGQRWHWPEE